MDIWKCKTCGRVLFLVVVLLAVMVVPSYGDSWCYQESANTTNQSGTDGSCIQVYNGTYVVSNTSSIGIIDINYTKASDRVSGAKWQFGTGSGKFNETLTDLCFQQTVIQLREESSTIQAFNGGASSGSRYSCWNGTGWQVLTTKTNYISGCSLGSPPNGIFSYGYDGNYSTCATFYQGPSYMNWSSTCSGSCANSTFTDEGIWWYILNTTTNSSRITTTYINQTNATLNGYCSSISAPIVNISYYYEWFLNGISYDSGFNNNSGTFFTPNIESYVANIDIGITNGDIWTLSCMVTDGVYNSTWKNTTLTMYNLAVSYKDTTTLTGLSNVTLNIYNSTGTTTYTNQTNISYIPKIFFIDGEYIFSATYNGVTLTKYLTPTLNTNENITFYFPSTTPYVQYFTVLDASNNPIQGASIVIQRYINGTLQTIDQCVSNPAGSCAVTVEYNVPYTMTVSATGYTTKSNSLTLFTGSPNPSNVYLSTSGTGNITDAFDGINATITPADNFYAAALNTSCISVANLSNMISTNYTVYYNNLTNNTWVFLNTSTSTTATGATITFLLNNTAKYNLSCVYSWWSNATGTNTTYTNTVARFLWITDISDGDMVDGILDPMTAAFIAIIICAVIGGLAAMYSPVFGMVLAACLLLMFTWWGFLPWYLVGLAILTAISLVILRSGF